MQAHKPPYVCKVCNKEYVKYMDFTNHKSVSKECRVPGIPSKANTTQNSDSVLLADRHALPQLNTLRMLETEFKLSNSTTTDESPNTHTHDDDKPVNVQLGSLQKFTIDNCKNYSCVCGLSYAFREQVCVNTLERSMQINFANHVILCLKTGNNSSHTSRSTMSCSRTPAHSESSLNDLRLSTQKTITLGRQNNLLDSESYDHSQEIVESVDHSSVPESRNQEGLETDSNVTKIDN